MSEKERLHAILVSVEAAEQPWTLTRSPTLGLYYLAQHATDSGFKVKVDCLSANDNVVRRLIRLLRRHECRLLGFFVDHDNQWALRHIVAGIKSALPDCDVVLGGPQVTGAPEQTLERISQALCGVVGEGEETFVELLRMPVRDHAALAQCQGLVFLGESGMVSTPPRPLITPLDRLSIPRREKLTLGRMTEPPSTLLTGRGCTGSCTFCFEGNASRRVDKHLRLHSVQRCLEEVDYLVRTFRPQCLVIMDDTFVADARRLREFCQGMIGRYHGRVKWFCEARVDSLWRQRDLLPLMIEAGLVRMQVGGESGCQHILDAYRKRITLEQLQWFADAAHAAGLHSAYINFIVGGAFETRETARRTREFACDLMRRAPAIVAVGHSLFTPYPATPIYENPEAYGLELLDQEVVTGFGDSHAFCRTAELTRFDILDLGHEFDKAVQAAMNDIAQALPLEVADRIFEGEHQWGIEGEWYEFLSQDSRWSGYYQALHDGRAKRLDDVPMGRIGFQVPLRTVPLLSSSDNAYVVETPRRETLRLDALDTMLLELSAGKLTFGEIASVVATETPNVPLEQVRASLLLRYRRLDQERLILWQLVDQIGNGSRGRRQENQPSSPGGFFPDKPRTVPPPSDEMRVLGKLM